MEGMPVKQQAKDFFVTAGILVVSFLFSLLSEAVFQTDAMGPMVFVLGVFLISVITTGYRWGIAASLIGMLAVNFVFTFPYFQFNFTIPVNFFSAVVMLVVAIITCALTTIYGSSSMLLENGSRISEEARRDLLRGIRDDAHWLVGMVENLLSVTRLDGGELRLNKTDTVLEELIDAVLVKFYKRCPEQNVKVTIPEDFVSIPMDAVLIGQVLTKLLENAVIHAAGMTVLELEVCLEAHHARFTVRDNGCGIAPDRLDDLFTGYLGSTDRQGDAARRNMGIGLSVCATIIKAHGGHINARNRPTGGAEFTFTLTTEE